VFKINYLGDWGKQIGLLGVGWEKFGSEELFQTDPVGHLLNVYAKIDELFKPEQEASKKARDGRKDTAEIESQGLYAERDGFFKRMEDGDEEAVALWKRFRDVSIEHYIKLYVRLNVSFDEYSGESQASLKIMTEVEDILKSKGICEESNGSWIIDFKKHGRKGGTGIVRGRTGSSTYLLRDLAAVLDRARKYSFDKMIYIVSADHDTHFQRMFMILELMDMSDLAGKLQHVHISKVSQMSEKLGHGHMLGEILDQCQRAMHDSLKANPEKSALLGDSEQAAATLGITALLAQELSARRANDHAFDIGRMTSFERGTGPDLQYWYARLCSILKEATPNQSDLCHEDFASLEEEVHTDLLRLLAQYPDITNSAYKALEPATIMAYLVNVTGQLSLGFGENQEGSSATPAQTALYETARQVLENGMKLLRITPATK
jgi:arginyl-tRNA synthetase